MLRQSFDKVMLVSHEQRSYAWKLTDSGVKSGYLIGWHAHFHGYGHLRRISGEAWRICRFRGSVWAFWLNHLKKFCIVIGLYFRRIRSREVFVNTALVFISECLLFRSSNVCYYEWFLPAISGNIFDDIMFSLRLRQTIWNLYTTFVYGAWKEYRCLTGEFCWQATSTTQAEVSL
jgi:hypothetical protein